MTKRQRRKLVNIFVSMLGHGRHCYRGGILEHLEKLCAHLEYRMSHRASDLFATVVIPEMSKCLFIKLAEYDSLYSKYCLVSLCVGFI